MAEAEGDPVPPANRGTEVGGKSFVLGRSGTFGVLRLWQGPSTVSATGSTNFVTGRVRWELASCPALGRPGA